MQARFRFYKEAQESGLCLMRRVRQLSVHV